MNRIFVSIGPVNIYWYSLIIVVAILVGYAIAVSYSKKINYKTGDIMEMVFYLILWAIIGARAYYVMFNFDSYKNSLLDILKIWEGGLAIYGAIIGGTLYLLYYCIKKGLNFFRMLDIFSLSLLLGQAIGRWGNFFNSEAYGGKTTYEVLKNLHIPKFIIDGMYIDGCYRHPMFLYESLWCLLGVVILWFIRKRDFYVNGRQVGFYLIWYGVGRLFIEGFRSDSLYLGNFRISQLVSIIIIGLGLLIFIFGGFGVKKESRKVDTIDRI